MIEARDLSGPLCAIPGFDAASYQPHSLHSDTCVWVEKNCYIDIWIEVLQALGCEPLAALGFTAAIDFEGDSWTFFKPPHEDLQELYGIDVQEMNVWRGLLDHVAEHLSGGKIVSTEANSFWLPDTTGTDYRRQYVKTTIVIVELDVAARRLGYFHNAGYFQLEGEDFTQLFALEGATPNALPLFAELIRSDRLVRREPQELAWIALRLLRKHIARRPASNPVIRFGERFQGDLPWLQDKGLETYHVWAFATFRQLGAAAELLAQHLRWLQDQGALSNIDEVAADWEKISTTAKAFILKVARSVNTKKPLDASPLFNEMSAAWESGMNGIENALNGAGAD